MSGWPSPSRPTWSPTSSSSTRCSRSGTRNSRRKCLGKMEESGKEGRTVLFVSHNMNAVERLCTKCLLLEKGQMAMYETDVRKVIKEYLFGGEEGGAVVLVGEPRGRVPQPVVHPPWFLDHRCARRPSPGSRPERCGHVGGDPRGGAPSRSRAEPWIRGLFRGGVASVLVAPHGPPGDGVAEADRGLVDISRPDSLPPC